MKLRLSLKKILFITIVLSLTLLGLGSDLSFASEDSDADLKDIDQQMKDVDKEHKALEKMGKTLMAPMDHESKKELPKNFIEKQENSLREKVINSNKNIDPEVIKKMKLHQVVDLAMAPVASMSEFEIENILRSSFSTTPFANLFNQSPKLRKFSVVLVKDRLAVSDLCKILENRERLIRFFAVMISTILIGFVIKKIFSSKAGILQALALYFIRLFIMMSIRLFVIYLFFGDELNRTFTLFLKTFLG